MGMNLILQPLAHPSGRELFASSISAPNRHTVKIRLLLAIAGLAISFALPTFAQQKETVDPKIIEQLNAISKKVDEAVNNNDAAAYAALYTEDAIFVAATGPLYGPEAIKKQYTEWFKGAHASNHTSKQDPNSARIVGTADKIAINGEWSATWEPPNGKPLQLKGYYLAIDTREGDAWKIWMLAFNVTPAPSQRRPRPPALATNSILIRVA